jgi:hypothetical protein
MECILLTEARVIPVPLSAVLSLIQNRQILVSFWKRFFQRSSDKDTKCGDKHVNESMITMDNQSNTAHRLG